MHIRKISICWYEHSSGLSWCWDCLLGNFTYWFPVQSILWSCSSSIIRHKSSLRWITLQKLQLHYLKSRNTGLAVGCWYWKFWQLFVKACNGCEFKKRQTWGSLFLLKSGFFTWHYICEHEFISSFPNLQLASATDNGKTLCWLTKSKHRFC